MALRWSWSFGNETFADLQTMGWTMQQNSAWWTLTSTNVYTYTGSPTRYGWEMLGIGYAYCELPAAVTTTLSQGWIAVPALALSSYSGGRFVQVTSGSSNTRIEISTGGALSLYVGNVFKETSSAQDFSSWRYVSLQFDHSGATWSARIYVDGSAVTNSQTQAVSAQTASTVLIQGALGTGGFRGHCFSQVIVWDSTSDAGETAYFATRAEPTADGTDVGTWTPSTGSDDFAVVDSPFATSTYTQEASPSANDRCEVVTSTLATALGVTPGEVAGVTAHTYSEGETVTARAIVSVSGGTEANGTSTSISAGSTTYAFATDTATYSGTDTIDVIYEVVTV